MNLVDFTDIDVSKPESLRSFFDSNYLVHETLYNAILTKYGAVIEHYPLFVEAMPPSADWLLTHDREHKAIASALSLSLPPDLDSCDFTNQQIVDDWMYDHNLLHLQLEQVIGL